MELHTLGVEGGYSEADVQAFARILTGWSVQSKDDASGSAFQFRERAHEPGSKKWLGHTIAAGEKGGLKSLSILATHRSTAQFIARKLATHFVSDRPSKGLIQRLAEDFERTGGDLSRLAKTLLTSPEVQKADKHKLKTPFEWVVSMFRGSGSTVPTERVFSAIRALGQQPYAALSPKGWSDSAVDWMGPEAMLSRLDIAERFGKWMGKIRPVDEQDWVHWLGVNVSLSTHDALNRAITPQQQWALLVMSPEFQRR
jgi:uncharacterized protein (DUF1800 family)